MLWITISVMLALFAGLIYLIVGTVPGKLMVVAQAAYKETIRQSLFWLLLAAFTFFMVLSPLLPYFTFGEDMKMMKDLELDAILLATLILTIFTASISISEEIEGRTAITLLSKPVSRRQFLLGKFFGILFAAMLLALLLTIVMGWTVNFKYDYDVTPKDERPADPAEIVAMENALSFMPAPVINVLRYGMLVFAEIQTLAPAVVLNFIQVTIITSVAVALATRLPMVLNLVICLVVFFMGRLTHVLEVQAGDNTLVKFVAQVFGTVLPGLNFYDVGPAIVSDVEVPWGGYVFPAALQGLVYTSIALLFGLILFEDRDLA